MSEPIIFSVKNHHVEDSGLPPQFDTEAPGKYFGYFANAYGEQSVFVYDREAEKGTLYMGDCGWNQPMDVIGGEVPDLIMNKGEYLWLKACWEAAVGLDPGDRDRIGRS